MFRLNVQTAGGLHVSFHYVWFGFCCVLFSFVLFWGQVFVNSVFYSFFCHNVSRDLRHNFQIVRRFLNDSLKCVWNTMLMEGKVDQENNLHNIKTAQYSARLQSFWEK